MKKAKLILGYLSLFPKRNLPFPISYLPPGWGMTKKTEGLNILVDKKKVIPSLRMRMSFQSLQVGDVWEEGGNCQGAIIQAWNYQLYKGKFS